MINSILGEASGFLGEEIAERVSGHFPGDVEDLYVSDPLFFAAE